jgi:hypothetical protein
MAFSVNERTSPDYYATLVDPTGALVPGSLLTTLTLTLYDVVSGSVLNSRNAQNVLNLNDVTVYNTAQSVTLSGGTVVSFNLWWAMRAADNVILGTRELERHVALFTATWTDANNKPRQLEHEIVILVTNLQKVA